MNYREQAKVRRKKMQTIRTKIRPIVSIVLLIMVTFFCQPSPVGGAPIVNTDKDTYNYGEMIKVNFSNSPGNDGDWICIVPVGSPDTEGGDYKHMPKGLGQGFLIFDPRSPGKYEVRAYYNYSRNGYVVSGRYAFSVVSSPEGEAAMAQRMERKIGPNNPLEVNLLPGNGLVYILREPWVLTDIVDVQIKANGKPIVVMPYSKYYLFSVPAGDVNFTTGSLIERNIQNGTSAEVWSVRAGEATIKVKPGYVYYLKLKVLPMGGLASFLENVSHQEGANLIDSYKLTLLK
jgi:hypothetical protein